MQQGKERPSAATEATLAPFSMDSYVKSIKAGYKNLKVIEKESKEGLEEMSHTAEQALVAAAQDQDADEDGWETVRRAKKPKTGARAVVQKMGERKRSAPKGLEAPPTRNDARAVFGNVDKKHKKKDFYSFQLTDRWRSKADRIASKLNMKKDVFGRPIQTANVTRLSESASRRHWKSEKLQSCKNQRDVRSFQRQ